MILTLVFTTVAFPILSFLMPKATQAKGKQFIHPDKFLSKESRILNYSNIHKRCFAEGNSQTNCCTGGKIQNTIFLLAFSISSEENEIDKFLVHLFLNVQALTFLIQMRPISRKGNF